MRAMPVTVGFRLTQADSDKLREIAQRTSRHPADIFRLLLRSAQLTGDADITLAPGAIVAPGPVEDVGAAVARHVTQSVKPEAVAS